MKSNTILLIPGDTGRYSIISHMSLIVLFTTNTTIEYNDRNTQKFKEQRPLRTLLRKNPKTKKLFLNTF